MGMALKSGFVHPVVRSLRYTYQKSDKDKIVKSRSWFDLYSRSDHYFFIFSDNQKCEKQIIEYFLCQNNDHLNFPVLKIDPAPNHLAPKWSYAIVPNLPSKVKFEVKN